MLGLAFVFFPLFVSSALGFVCLLFCGVFQFLRIAFVSKGHSEIFMLIWQKVAEVHLKNQANTNFKKVKIENKLINMCVFA